MRNQTIPILVILFCTFWTSVFSTDFYWVNGSGNWSDAANHWATTSGGTTFHLNVPGAGDDVYFDANSFSASGGRVVQNLPVHNCRNMDWTGSTGNPTLEYNQQFNIYGDLTLQAGMTFEATNSPQWREIHFLASGPAVLDFQGAIFRTNNNPLQIYLEGQGQYQLQSDLEESSTGLLLADFVLEAGASLATNGFVLRCSNLILRDNSSTNLSTSEIHCSMRIEQTSTLMADSAMIYPFRIHSIGNHQLHKVFYDGSGFLESSGGDLEVEEVVHGVSSLQYNELLFEGDVQILNHFEVMDADAVLYLDDNTELELAGNVVFHGNANQAIQIVGRNGVETLLRNGTDLCFEYVHFWKIAATGTANWIAGVGCLDLGSNSGITWNGMPCQPVSITGSLGQDAWELGPNPVRSGEMLRLKAHFHLDVAVLRVFNVQGNLILRQDLEDRSMTEVNLPEIDAGLYVVEITANEEVWREKILVWD